MAVLTDFSIDSWKVVLYALDLAKDKELYVLCYAENSPGNSFCLDFKRFTQKLSNAYHARLYGHILSGDLTFELGAFSSDKCIDTLVIPNAFMDKGKLTENLESFIEGKVIRL